MQSRLSAAIWMRFGSQCTSGDVSSSFPFLFLASTLLPSESAILSLSMSTPVSFSKTTQLQAVIPKLHALPPSFSHPSSSACPFVRSAEYAPSAAAATSCSTLFWVLVFYLTASEQETLEPDMFRTTPLCMRQYSRLFGACRIPKIGCDEGRCSATEIIANTNDSYLNLYSSPIHV